MSDESIETPLKTKSVAGDLLSAWLLLLLLDAEGGESYGWDLGRALTGRGVEHDMSALYRKLRGFQSDGFVTTRWSQIKKKPGPRRRVYVLTPAGLARLGEYAEEARARRTTYDALIAVHDGASVKP